MIGILCITAVNICYAEIEKKLVTLISKESNLDELVEPYQLVDAGQKGKIITIITKEITVKKENGKEEKLSYYKWTPRVVARCIMDHSIKNSIKPSEDNPNPTLTCPEGSGIEVLFTFCKLPKGYQYSDFTYHADLIIKSDDNEDNVGVQKIASNQQQIKEAEFKNFLTEIDKIQHSKEAQEITRISNEIKKLQEQEAFLAAKEAKFEDKIAKLQAEYALAAKKK